MKAGSEYETFIFETFSRFFPDFKIVKNDKIMGSESARMREIDVSMRGKAAGTNILYIIQAKDHARPADINIIGASSTKFSYFPITLNCFSRKSNPCASTVYPRIIRSFQPKGALRLKDSVWSRTVSSMPARKPNTVYAMALDHSRR
jgi:hypothetical protein